MEIENIKITINYFIISCVGTNYKKSLFSLNNLFFHREEKKTIKILQRLLSDIKNGQVRIINFITIITLKKDFFIYKPLYSFSIRFFDSDSNEHVVHKQLFSLNKISEIKELLCG